MTETKSIWVSRERQRRRQNWSDESGCDGKERVGDGDGDEMRELRQWRKLRLLEKLGLGFIVNNEI